MLSIRYWCRHRVKLCLLIFIIAAAAGVLSLMFLLVRSYKTQRLEQLLSVQGDYDIVASNTDLATAKAAEEVEGALPHGMFMRCDDIKVEGGFDVPAIAFRDELSQKVYHLAMIRGRYPRRADEIALDLTYCKGCGVAPYAQGTVTAEVGGEKKQFRLVGIFDAQNNYRRDEIVTHEGSYIPNAVLDSSFFNENGSSYTGFGQVDGEIKALPEGVQACLSRRYVYGYVLGTDRFKYGEADSIDKIRELVRKGKTYADPYSLLIPMFSAIIGLVAVISLYRMAVNIFEDRMKNSGILLAIGMSKRRRLAMLAFEIAAVSAAALPLGILAAVGVFRLTVRFSKMPDAFAAPGLIKQVTYDPWLTSALVTGAAVVTVCVMFIIKYRCANVLELTSGRKALKHARRRVGRRLKKAGWLRSVFWGVRFTNFSIGLLIIIGVVCMSFGLIFSSEAGRLQSNETLWTLQSQGVDKVDYTASRQSESTLSPNIYLGYGDGIPYEKIDSFKQALGSDISQIKCCTVNNAAMMIFDTKRDDLPHILTDNTLNKDMPQMWAAAGYSESERAVSTPIAAVDEKVLEQLGSGADIKAVADGKECIIAVSEASYESVKNCFDIGDEITLSVIMPNEGAQNIDVSAVTLEDCQKYGTPVQTQNGTDYCFGHRKDIRARIGGIIPVKQGSEEEYYCQMTRANIFVAKDTLSAWGLLDKNCTDICVKLDDSADTVSADKAWYAMLNGCKGMKSASAAELKGQYEREKNGVRNIFLNLQILLTVLLIIGITLCIYSLLRRQRKNAARLRAIGMSKARIGIVSVIQNEVFVIAAGLLSVLPVYAFDRLSRAAFAVIDNGTGEILLDETNTPHSVLMEYFLYDGFIRYKLMNREYLMIIVYTALLFALLTAAAAVLPIMLQSKTGITRALKEE